jgi:hypothetical protein
MRVIAAIGFLVGLGIAGVAVGADAVTFRAVGGDVAEGGDISCAILIDNSSSEVYGWSYGVCYDTSLFTLIGTSSGLDTQTIKGGNPPDWDLAEPCADGVSRGVIIDMMLGAALPVENGFRDFNVVLRARDLTDTDPDVITTTVRPCHEEVCDPPTRAVWTNEEGTSVEAAVEAATVRILKKVVVVKYTPVEGARVRVDAETGNVVSPRTVGVNLEEEPLPGSGSGTPAQIEGFSLAMGYDPGAIVIQSLGEGAGLAGLNGGTGPAFFDAAIEPACFAVRATMSLATPVDYLEADTPVEVVAVTLDVPPGVYTGQVDPVSVELPFVAACSSPPVANSVLLAGGEEIEVRDLAVSTLDVVVDPGVSNAFRRGDANVDGRIDVGDVVALINEFFRDGERGTCRLAKDANGDRRADLSDVVYMIGFLFQHAFDAPPAPYPDCGVVPDQVLEDCLDYPPCAN